MLNPSTADADKDDPTIRKCKGFAERLGYGGIIVTNLYAYRTTYPAELKVHGYQIGPDNDSYIDIMCSGVDTVLCAWGAHARGLNRPLQVLNHLIRDMKVTPKALAYTADGIPRHPLMLSYSSQLTNIVET